ncbi:MAG: tetratricopeptide repeat protein, partial [Bacteroidota bacterium]|nr:tetratricopeptide repeat protein [Bacteroidota bacterium]
YYLGLMYYVGHPGVLKDNQEAVKWYQMAAEQGHAGAQLHLGGMYDQGHGVPQDDQEAVKWYRLSADQGKTVAQSNLGLMYFWGRGVPRDVVRAYAWLNVSAAAGGVEADEARDVVRSIMTADQVARAQRLSATLVRQE